MPSPERAEGENFFVSPEAVSTDFFEKQPNIWIILGDVHGRAEKIRQIPEIKYASGILVTGDLTKNGTADQARRIVSTMQELVPTVYAQFGNMDRAEVNDWLETAEINTHRHVRSLWGDVAAVGVGASTPTPFATFSEFSEVTFAGWLRELGEQIRGIGRVVFLSHNPPVDTVCDKISGSVHVGSRSVREFIEEYQPEICFCGHIHESRGQQLLGHTLVVNPGSFASGFYAVLTESASGGNPLLQVSLLQL